MGHELRRPLHADQAHSGVSNLTQVGQYALAENIGSAMVLLFTAFQTAWPAFAYGIRDERAAKRAYSYVLTYLLLIASWAGARAEPLRAVARALARSSPTSGRRRARSRSLRSRASSSRVSSSSRSARDARSARGFNWIAATAAAVVNFGLNFWLIPAYGMLGAAYATLIAYIVLMAIRTVSAQKIYPVRTNGGESRSSLLTAGALTGIGEAFRQSLALAFVLTLSYPLVLAALGFYLPAERRRLRRLLPAH